MSTNIDTETMRGAYVLPDGELTLTELPIPAAGGEVTLLRTLVSAVCGSDLHRFRGADSYGFDTDIFGHETVGEVLRCDSGRFAVGQRVLHVPFPADGKVFAPYQYAHEGQLVPLPDGLESEQAVFAQQLGTVIYALNRYVVVGVPEAVFIAGCGPSGLLFLQLLRERGCKNVYVSEPDPYRLALAQEFGAQVEPPNCGIDLAVDTSGTLQGRQSCVTAVRSGGTIGIFGLPDEEPGELGVSVLELLGRNLTVVGAMGAQGEPDLPAFREALHLIASGRVQVDRLISHTGTLQDLVDLCHKATDVTGGVAKVLVTFTPTPDTRKHA